MNVFIVVFFLFSMCNSNPKFLIELSQPTKVREGIQYRLRSNGANGNVRYEVAGMPEGCSVNGDRILFSDRVEGLFHVLKVTAIDDQGTKSSQLFTITNNQPQFDQEIITETNEDIEKGFNTEEKLTSILNSYSSIEEKKTIKYQQNRYPEPSILFESSGETFNTIPLHITNTVHETVTQQQQIEEKQSSESDVNLRVASERHQNAIKVITNILHVIDQARSNKKAAEKFMQRKTEVYNEALSNQRYVQENIIKLENKLNQANTAVDSLGNIVIDLQNNTKHNILKNSRFQAQRANLLKNIANEEKNKAKFLEQLKKNNNKLALQLNQKVQTEKRCGDLGIEVDDIVIQLDFMKIQLDQTIKKKTQTEAVRNQKKQKVKKLREELDKAEKQLTDVELEFVSLKAEEERLPKAISRMQKQYSDYDSQFIQCNDQVTALNKIINTLQKDEATSLSVQIEKSEEKITSYKKKVIDIDVKMAKSLKQLQDLKVKLNKSMGDLQFLSEQVSKVKEELQIEQIEGKNANTEVAHAKQSVNAALYRLQEETKIASDATFRLEKARAEEALARSAIEEIIAQYSDALPYSIVASESTVGSGGNSLSQLGSHGNSGFYIDDWQKYLQNVFGAGINPHFSGTVTNLYPVSPVGHMSYDEQSNLRGGKCGGFGPQRVTTGLISSLSSEGFKVTLQNGEQYDIKLAPCTQLTSNKQNYSLQVGDQTIVKGTYQRGQTINGSQVICLGA